MALTDLMRVMSHCWVNSHWELTGKIEELKIRVDALRRGHREELSEKMRIAALVQMLLGDIRDMVCQRLSVCSTYRGIRDRDRNFASNRRPWAEPRGYRSPS